MELHDLWFGAIAVLFVGYFVLEGFDFGVGILTRVLARGETERRVLINTIGPVWDGNEVWVLTAGGAIFAAFPEWYASLFSGFYLPLLVILLALILRGVAFEYRGKESGGVDGRRWRARWDLAIFWGSLLPAFLWGVALGNVVRGVDLDSSHLYTGTVLGLLNPYALLAGLTTLGLFVVHGALFVALKTTGGIRVRAAALAGRAGPVVALVAVAFLAWSVRYAGHRWTMGALALVAALCLVGALTLSRLEREGRAFALSSAAIGLAVAALFTGLYPYVLPSGTGYGLTVSNASATHHTLTIMTVVVAVFLPLVLAYQGWTYWVFRNRISTQSIPDAQGTPA